MLLLVQLLPPVCIRATWHRWKIILSFVYQVTKGILYCVLQGMQALENDSRGIGRDLFFVFTHILLMQLVPLPLNLFRIGIYINLFLYLRLLLLHLWLLLIIYNRSSSHRLWELDWRATLVQWWFLRSIFILRRVYRNRPTNNVFVFFIKKRHRHLLSLLKGIIIVFYDLWIPVLSIANIAFSHL